MNRSSQDLLPFRGQTVRIAFVEEENNGYFNAHLDEVRLVVLDSDGTAGGVITNDVYFGECPLGPEDYLGTTTNTSWDLPLLSPATTYCWQIVARRVGVTPGPIWQFTTRGVDHFVWAPIPSPQRVYSPFAVQLTAQDEFDRPVTNFSGTVSLRAEGAGAAGSVGILTFMGYADASEEYPRTLAAISSS